jgi:hypothetical protein
MRGRRPTSRSVQARGLRKVLVLIPEDCVESLRRFAQELRAWQRGGPAPEWRRLSPSAELLVDPGCGARCAIRDTGAPGAERYFWTVTAFGGHAVAAGRTGEVAEARLQAEVALAVHMADWPQPSGDESANA